MKKLTINGNQIAQEDLKFFSESGDPGFSPEHNRSVIASTIRKHNALIAKRKKEYREKLAERADAAAAFLKHKDMGKSTSVEQYFGQELRHLRAQRILARVLDRRNKIYKLEEA